MIQQFMQCIWQSVVNLGVNEKTSFSEARFVIFTNVVALLTAIGVIVYAPLSFLTGKSTLGIMQIIDGLCVSSVLYINYRGWHNLARFVFIGVVNGFVYINSLFIGYESRVHEFFVLSNVIPFFVFPINERMKILIGCLISIGGYLLYHYTHDNFTYLNMPLQVQQEVNNINILMKFFLFGVSIYLLAFYNHKAENTLAIANEKLQKYSDDLQRSNTDLEQFAYTISHDLKAPVRNIASFLSLYKTRYANTIPTDGQELLAVAHNSSVRLGKLIDDLLEYSKLDRNLPQECDVNVQDLVRSISLEIRQGLQERNAEVLVQGVLPTLHRVHSSMLYHVFQNLITNGIKFNKSKRPTVTISAQEMQTHFRFRVRDNGIGIPTQYRDKLFHLFRRLHTTEYEGTGIGLAIVKKIVNMYNGNIWIESEEGKGSTFIFEIEKRPPLADEKKVATQLNGAELANYWQQSIIVPNAT